MKNPLPSQVRTEPISHGLRLRLTGDRFVRATRNSKAVPVIPAGRA